MIRHDSNVGVLGLDDYMFFAVLCCQSFGPLALLIGGFIIFYKWLVDLILFFIVVKLTNQFPSGKCPCFSGEKG